MACKKSIITNNLGRISVISYTRCNDNFVVNNYEIQENETVNIWYVDGTYKTAFSNLTIDSTIEWPPITQTPSSSSTTPTPTPSNTATPSVTPSVTPTNTSTPTVTPTNTVTSTNTPTQSVTPTNTGTPLSVTPTPTPTVTQTNTSTPTTTPTNTESPTPTVTPTNTETSTPTVTPTSETSTPTPTNTETPTVTPTITPTNTESPTPTTTPTNTETPTPTTTPTNTPSNTQTPSVTPTLTPTPSTTPIPVTGYGFNLVVLPYEFPTTGNTIMTNGMSATTNPNLMETISRGIYFNSIDSDGIDRTSYFSGFTGQSVTITLSQTGSTAIYSGSTNAFKNWSSTGETGFVFGTGISIVPSGLTGTTVLIQSATTNWVTGQTVYISAVINVPVTPTPTPTNTVTPTNTSTETPTPTPTRT